MTRISAAKLLFTFKFLLIFFAGGEYETVTLDCPLFKEGFIVVTEWQKKIDYKDPAAPVCLSSPIIWKVEQKTIPITAVIPRKPALVECARFKPYEYLIMDAVNRWKSTRDYSKLRFSPFHDDGGAPDWIKIKTSSFLAGCTLTADISLFADFKSAGFCPALKYYFPLEYIKKTLLNTLKEWLEGKLPGLSSDSVQRVKYSSFVQTICQIRHSGLINIIKEAFELKKIKPHPVTFIITHLPQDILTRFTMVLSGQSTKNTKNTNSLARSFSWKNPTEDAALHTHSLNLWVPSCLDMNEFYNAEKTEEEKTKVKGTRCCSCQAVRCELLISDGAPPAAAGGGGFCGLFLRGCDGRFPYSGLFPDVNDNPSLKDFAGRREASPQTEEGLNVMLQVTNAFLNMQEAMRLCHGATKTSWLFTLKGQEEESDLQNVRRPATYCFPPSCILLFISLSCRSTRLGGSSLMDENLKTVKDFVEGLTVRFLKWIDDPRVLSNQENSNKRCIVIVAEVPELPGGAKTLMMPLCEIVPQRKFQIKTFSSTEHLRRSGPRGWSGTITVLKRLLHLNDDELNFFKDEEEITSTFVSISFMPEDDEEQRLSGLLEQVNQSLMRVFSEHFSHERSSQSEGTEASDEEGINEEGISERTLEVFVFYTEACFRRLSFGTNAEMFEKSFRLRLQLCDGVIPAITFFPVKTLANGLLEILLRSTA